MAPTKELLERAAGGAGSPTAQMFAAAPLRCTLLCKSSSGRSHPPPAPNAAPGRARHVSSSRTQLLRHGTHIWSVPTRQESTRESLSLVRPQIGQHEPSSAEPSPNSVESNINMAGSTRKLVETSVAWPGHVQLWSKRTPNWPLEPRHGQIEPQSVERS